MTLGLSWVVMDLAACSASVSRRDASVDRLLAGTYALVP